MNMATDIRVVPPKRDAENWRDTSVFATTDLDFIVIYTMTTLLVETGLAIWLSGVIA
jgi:hypothetical protein